MAKGINETREALVFLGKLSNTIGEVAADKKVTLLEWFKFINLFPVIAPAVDNYSEIGPELLDLNEDERQSLVLAFNEAIDLPNGSTEDLAVEGADLALHMMQFISKVRAAKAAKAA